MPESTRRAPRRTATPKISPAQKAAATRAVPPVEPFIGKLAELADEVRLPPYPVTATLSVEAPDQARLQRINQAQTAYIIASNQLDSMMLPLPDPSAKDGILRDDRGAPVLPDLDKESLKKLEEVAERAGLEYDKALFGAQYEAVIERFKNEQGVVWNTFYKNISDYFLPTPEGGTCPTCGHVVDEEAEGNDDESPTSLSATG